MITLSELKTELQNIAELDSHVERVKAYRNVLISAVKYIYQKKCKRGA